MLAFLQHVADLGLRTQWLVGQHNDRELSCYCVTPSGFELDVGWNPVMIGPELESTWDPTTYQGIGGWCHTTVLDKFAQFRQALRTMATRRSPSRSSQEDCRDDEYRLRRGGHRPRPNRWPRPIRWVGAG
ncbi:hypothetical protein AB4305_20330 [Nocardia sp. 2YAB30]|uniref:hypothetical protein n=1 Tax=unclassified Nocardia TaxID=2637762 RepID=UPI003F9CC3CE